MRRRQSDDVRGGRALAGEGASARGGMRASALGRIHCLIPLWRERGEGGGRDVSGEGGWRREGKGVVRG